MSTNGSASYLDLAIRLADAAAPIAQKYFRTPLDIETKPDASPVTIADKEIETALRTVLGETVPEHGILGEEHGAERLDAEYVWVIDPIDGTRSFSIGKPLFGTLIGLAHNGVPVLGIIDNPAIGERWIGIKDQPTTFNGNTVTVRTCPDIAQAWMTATSPHMFLGDALPAFEALKKDVRHTIYGCDCNAYGYLANGYLDLVCESDLKPYDYIALVTVIEGAGGVITDWQGQPLSLKSDGRVIAAGDKRSHEAALAALTR
jgi:inositol-phosphate phosphatase/L-galactose 1-phosphate phosphatase/histidinol-phosphatase